MSQSSSRFVGPVLAGLMGGIVGGILVLLAARAMPWLMAGRMRQMMATMKECGVDIPET